MRRVWLIISVLVVMGLAYAGIWGWNRGVTRAREFAQDAIMGRQAMETSTIEESFGAGTATRLVIENDLGAVEVTAAATQTKQVRVTRTVYAGTDEKAVARARKVTLAREATPGGDFRISVKADRERPRMRVNLKVEAPAEIPLYVEVGSGAITVAGMRKGATAKTGSGGIVVTNIAGKVTAETGSGAVEASGLQGGISARTGSGGLSLQKIDGPVTAKTFSGGVTLSDVRGDTIMAESLSGGVYLYNVEAQRISAETASGEIVATVLNPFSGEMKLKVGSGGISLGLSAKSNCTIRARTASGSVTSSLPMRETSSSRSEVGGVLGTGQGTVEVTTGSGGITLEAAKEQ